MSSSPRTAPFDVVLALRLLAPAGTLTLLANELAVAPSQVHAALTRLRLAGLLRPNSRVTNPRALGEFLIHGLRYAFPAWRGPLSVGIPTAYSAPPLSSDVDAPDVLVWSAPRNPLAVQGFAITPLYPGALKLPERSPPTYALLAIVDALRLGDPRTQSAARDRIAAALGIQAE